MTNTNWQQSEFDTYYSHHILVTYLGDQYPKYHIIEDGEGWLIGVFYSFIGGEYVPLEEDGEETLVFKTAEAAMRYVDVELERA